jgi:general secretion pathway protein J
MRRAAGFTLIELLVSLTLLGLLFVLLFGSLRFGTRAWERTAASIDATDSIRFAQDFLRHTVERTCPRLLPPTQNSAALRVDFSGAPDAMRFLGPAPVAAGGLSCEAMALEVRPEGRQRQLVLRAGDGAAVTNLLHQAQTIDFSYRSPSGDWQSSWSGATLPQLVRIRVTFPKNDPRLWPELFVAPRISAEADCTYDAATGTCRSG